MKAILVVGSWGSGTTALAGALVKLGVPGFGPFFRSNDPRTGNTYELQPFRDLIQRFSNENTPSLRPNCTKQLIAALREFRRQVEDGGFGDWPIGGEKRLMLKVPIASLCIPHISTVFDTDVVMVLRRWEHLEASRRRRGWPANFGEAGAQVIYSEAINNLMQMPKSFLALSYCDLLGETKRSLERVIDFCGLQDLKGNLDQAAAFVRQDA